MDAYIYQASLICKNCAEEVKARMQDEGKSPTNPSDEYSYDSDDYPKGPYSNGGGEADVPQHCNHCGVFLENPLTVDGSIYVEENPNPAWDAFYGVDRENS